MTSPTNLLQLADEYARAYFMGREYDARKRLQTAIIVAETDALKAEQKAVADEREACAKVCDSLNFIDNGTPAGARTTNRHCASAIRARGRDDCANTPYDEGPFTISNFHPR